MRALPLLRHIICDLRVGLSKTGFTKSRGDREILTHQIQAKGPFARFRIFHHGNVADPVGRFRSEEHTSELQSLMRISYAVFCLKKKKKQITSYRTSEYHN